MKISKVYSNKNFKNIEFKEGFNVIIGEIFDKTKTDKDTHNLGKTLLIEVIDFLLLKKINAKGKFFLTNGSFLNQFFFIEILLNSGLYLVIRRGTDNPNLISFKINEEKLADFEQDLEWDYEELHFEKSKEMLNNFLNFDILNKWSYRKSINYFLRSQYDYSEVFRLKKFEGKDIYWKPFVFDLLGFDGNIIEKKYALENEKIEKEKFLKKLEKEADIKTEEIDKIYGLLEIKNNEKLDLEKFIDDFDFFNININLNYELVNNIDEKIKSLNTSRYNITYEVNKIQKILRQEIPDINFDHLKSLYGVPQKLDNCLRCEM